MSTAAPVPGPETGTVYPGSSFISYVLGHDLGLSLPGGSWARVTGRGTIHGPVVMDYATWGGAVTIPTPNPGALVIWNGVGTNAHIGISIGGGRMISAYDTASGTIVTPIAGNGPTGAGRPMFRRVLGVEGGQTVPAGAGRGGGGVFGDLASVLGLPLDVVRGIVGAESLFALALVGAGTAAVLLGALIVGAVGSWAVMAGMSALSGGGQPATRAQEA